MNDDQLRAIKDALDTENDPGRLLGIACGLLQEVRDQRYLIACLADLASGATSGLDEEVVRHIEQRFGTDFGLSSTNS